MIYKTSDIVIPAFYEFWRETRSPKILYHVLKGGRGSGKSTTIAQRLILDLIEYPITILCVRKVGNTLVESCYEQLKDAIDQLNLNDKFRLYKNPLKIEYLARGNTIIFRGADDPLKIKSIKVSKYPIARLWINISVHIKPT